MDNPSQLRRTFQGVVAGSEPAMERLVNYYESHIRRVVRRRMPRQMRTKFDSTDFVQMVWASTFRNRRRFDQLTQHSDFVRFLTTLARNKVVQELRKRLQTQGYNVNRERALQGDGDGCLSDRDPSPSEWAIARERWERIVQNLPARQRRIVWLRMQGATYVEIAERLQLHERTVRKIIRRLEA
jgi:RNA polymerase sigma factor (sigma-70 family)